MSSSPPSDLQPVTRALISVSDKRGLLDFARELAARGIELLSSGGTWRHLSDAGIAVREVSEYTGFPEMLDGRVKTLHPKIHGGILFRRDLAAHRQAAEQAGIGPIDVVVVNLYPFEETIARPATTLDEAIEQIDIGGPSLIRGAAKNHEFVAVVTAPEQYEAVLGEIRELGGTTLATRRALAVAAFERTNRYDAAIASYLSEKSSDTESRAAAASSARDKDKFPDDLHVTAKKSAPLRYGENPHQRACLYEDSSRGAGTLTRARQLHGKELSYNNYLDLDSALAIVRLIDMPAVAVIKHNNPCGAAADDVLREATRSALDGDPLSAFGSVLAFNRHVDAASADVLSEPDRFIEAIVAPGFDEDAIRVLTTKPKWRQNVRLLELGDVALGPSPFQLRQIDGGLLVQEPDDRPDPTSEWKVVTRRQPDSARQRDIQLGWSVVRVVKSNAIVVCRDGAVTGVGAGQMSRVDAVEIALKKSGERARGAVLASDAFFPFHDSIELAAAAGVATVIQPGGSRNDPDVIAACDRHGLAMIFTGRRHFRH